MADSDLLASGKEKLPDMGLTKIDGVYLFGAYLIPDFEQHIYSIKSFDLKARIFTIIYINV